MLCAFTGCKPETKTVFEQKTYEINVDYIGENYEPSEFVKGVSLYGDVKEYAGVQNKNNTVWIEEATLGSDIDFIKSLLDEGKTVIALAGKDSGVDDFSEKLTGEAPRGKSEGDFDFLGILFCNITDVEKNDTVLLYCTDKNEPQTEFLAFCSEYKYSERYQASVLVNDIMDDAVILNNCFTVINFSEQAYAVQYSTLVDYMDNPTAGTDPYRYEYTIMTYADVVSSKGKSAGFNLKIYAGGDGMTVKTCPDADMQFETGTDMYRNFLFKRTFDASFDMDYKGVIKPLIKGRDSAMEWSISAINKKKEEQSLYNSKNMTGVIDCVNTTGIYTPQVELRFSTQNGEEITDWSSLTVINETSPTLEK